MSVAASEPSFVAVNAAVLTATVATVPPPPSPVEPQQVDAVRQPPKRRNINDGRKWLAALLMVTAAGGATAVVLNPALRPTTLAFTSFNAAPEPTPARVPLPPVPAVAVQVTAAAVAAPPRPPAPLIDNPRPSPSDNPQLLWQYALNAESHRDFETATRLYQRLESLPNTQWPPGLHTRLLLAQQELASGLH